MKAELDQSPSSAARRVRAGTLCAQGAHLGLPHLQAATLAPEVPHGEMADVARPRASASDHVDDRDELWSALRALSPQQRAVLVLRYFEDLTEHDIATVLGCSPGAVKTHAAPGLSRLRQRTELTEGWSR